MTPSPLRLARVSACLTQAELARQAGLSENTVVRLEGGRHSPRAGTRAAIAAVIGLPPEVIFPTESGE